MKTAISLPDSLFERAERLAESLGKSRSELYRDALAEYMSRREKVIVTDEYNRLADELPETDRWAGEAGRRALERNEWS